MTDPRDTNFFKLQKKARASLENLTSQELRQCLRYAEKMSMYASAKKGRSGWIELMRRIDGVLKSENA